MVKKLTVLGFTLSFIAVNAAHATLFKGFDLTELGGFESASRTNFLQVLVEKSKRTLNQDLLFSQYKDNRFLPRVGAADAFTTTLKYSQNYKGIEFLGDEALFHFDVSGNLESTTGAAVPVIVSSTATLTEATIRKIIDDRYQTEVGYSEPIQLRFFQDEDRTTHLVYLAKTATSEKHQGHELLIDAHSGLIMSEANRMHDAAPLKLTRYVYSANTPEGRKHLAKDGSPTDINIDWYQIVVNNSLPTTNQARAQMDQSALKAYLGSGIVYSYYKTRFGRLSFDNKNTPLVSVVHMGVKFDNAFWTDEFKLMAYGDGDGANFTDFTQALDVVGHELTHAVTASTANLAYAAQAGALNESFSDFFGKMITFQGPNENWNIGEKIMGPAMKAKGQHALRNMANPNLYKQPAFVGDKYMEKATTNCNDDNDNCGVHTNSGIPSRAAVLITQTLGKVKAEQLYYNVLTQRLTLNSNFRAARNATLTACATMFGGATSKDCLLVKRAFDTVKM